MLNIYNIHLVTTNLPSFRLTQRNCVNYHEFDHFLSSGFVTFDKMKDALRKRNGTVLTIDDATTGAYDVAMLCAAHKQYVTLFINPYYIETGRQYHMHYLSQMLEDLGPVTFCFNGNSYDMSNPKEVKYCRKAIKEKLCCLDSEDACIAFLEQLFERKISSVRLPYHLRTMTREQMNTLISTKYVFIEYHGWTHTCPSALSVLQLLKELAQGRDWFHETLHKDIRYYALPFGKRDSRLEGIPDFPLILLEDRKIDVSLFKHNVINRKPIEQLLETWRAESKKTPRISQPVFSVDGSILIRFPANANDELYCIPNTVSIIGNGAFNECINLKHVVIPSSVHVIQRNAFANSGLESISIPDSVKEIGDLCFYACRFMKSIQLPNSLHDLGDAVFSECVCLEEITLPISLKKVGDGLFMGCKSLKNIYLPTAIKPLRDSSFIACPNLPSIHTYD